MTGLADRVLRISAQALSALINHPIERPSLHDFNTIRRVEAVRVSEVTFAAGALQL